MRSDLHPGKRCLNNDGQYDTINHITGYSAFILKPWGEGCQVKIYGYGDAAAPLMLIQPVDSRDLSLIESEIKEISRLTDKKFCLSAVKIEDWNNDLSPWAAPAVFGKEPFGGGAENTLKEILRLCSDKDKKYIIGGYSLAGLFAVWSAYRCDAFSAVAAASPSVWFPGFVDFMREGEIRCAGVCLSLGDKEEKTKNPVTATVGDRIREARSILCSEGINCSLEWNEGNHFKDADIRTAKVFARAAESIQY